MHLVPLYRSPRNAAQAAERVVADQLPHRRRKVRSPGFHAGHEPGDRRSEQLSRLQYRSNKVNKYNLERLLCLNWP